MYTHVISSLVLKAARASKELYSSSLVVSPSKECKQDRIDLSFIPLFTLVYGLAFSMEGCALHVVCWIVIAIFLFAFVRYMLLLLGGKRQIGRLGLDSE